MAVVTLVTPSTPRALPGMVDFYRPVYSLLGLPVDAVTLRAAQERIYTAAATRRPCFLSTPNLNFAIACLADREFRDSVIHSDLSLADGMPLVWIARLFGIPIRERVTGSSLFEHLRQYPGRILSLFFFGGPDGAAATAAARINAEPSGLQCVGSRSPGFGSLDELSTEAVIQDINASRADFLVVALGAKKGQAWIERNRARLRVPVLSHLGAVVNFAAGRVRRAPQWMQRAGLEWLWRIREEPALWRRYLHDGAVLLRLLVMRVIPGALYQRLRSPSRAALLDAWVSLSDEAGRRCIRPHGAWCEINLVRIRRSFEKAARLQVDVDIDLGAVTHVDSAFVGLLMLMYGHQSQYGLGFTAHGASPTLQRMFKSYCADFLLETASAKKPEFAVPPAPAFGQSRPPRGPSQSWDGLGVDLEEERQIPRGGWQSI